MSILNVHPGGQAFVRVDYSRSVEEVYASATRAIIRERQDLTVLGLCTKEHDSDRTLGLPLWVPDWASVPKSQPLTGLDPPQRFETAHFTESTFSEETNPARLNALGSQHGHIEQIIFSRFDLAEEAIVRLIRQHELETVLAKRRPKSLPTLTRDVIMKIIVAEDKYSMGVLTPGGIAAIPSFFTPNWRNLGVLADGRVGLLPKQTRVGDLVWILDGCDFPIVLRHQAANEYIVVGVCYVSGMICRQMPQLRREGCVEIVLV